MQGWFHGHGVFWRADGMKFEGEFRGGRIWGLGKLNSQPTTKYMCIKANQLEELLNFQLKSIKSNIINYRFSTNTPILKRLLFLLICSGLVTYNDGSHGFPRNEGFFQDCRLVRKRPCPEIIHKAQKISLLARTQAEVQ